MSCPQYSMSAGGQDMECTCIGERTTRNGATETNSVDMPCVCKENYHLVNTQCMPCPANSIRSVTASESMCTCMANRSTISGNTTTSGSTVCLGK